MAPRFVRAGAAVTIALLIFSACTSESGVVDAPEEVAPFQTLMQGSIEYGEAEPAKVVLRDEHQAERFLTSVSPSERSGMARALLQVDFREQMVLGLLLGRRGSGSIIASIDSVGVVDDRLRVYSTEFRPAYQTRDVAYPAHLVVVGKTDRPVDFRTVEVIEEISPTP